jgi:hypothetical protein
MRLSRIVWITGLISICQVAAAQSIFNTQSAQPQGSPQQKLAPAPVVPSSSVSAQVQANGFSQPIPSPLVDPKVMEQFDQQPNESNEAYMRRLRALSQKAIADMERVSRETNARMKTLAPK